MDLKWVISEEERTRHDALFYSQKPQDRYLSGEQARSLFIRSKLPLPELSKIWKLADVTRNNKLDISEFAVAMHLIQSRLKGTDIPVKLPETLVPTHVPHVTVPVVSEEEKAVYERAFMWKNNEKTGYIIDAETACSILTGSGVTEDVLARIWNLADIDRDGKLSLDEFFVALHLTRFCKQGNSLEGSVNARSILSQQLTEECYEGKKLRLAEVQTEKRKLLSLKEKLCHEIAGDLEEESMAHKIQEELDQVERQVYVLEKEENELRRTLQQLKDKSKRESFKPFDRSFLLKRQPTGESIFSGASKRYRTPITDKVDEEILKLWREDGDLSDFGASISEEPSIPALHSNIRQDQFGHTVIELSESHEPSSSNTSTEPPPLPATNGVSNDLDANGSHSVYSDINGDELNQTRGETSDLTRQENQAQEGSTEVETKTFDNADRDNKGYLLLNGSSSSNPQPTTNGDLPTESIRHIELESKNIGDSTSDKKTMDENRTDDEKTGSLQMSAKNGPYTTTSEKGVLAYDAGEITTKPTLQGSLNSSRIPVEETVHVATAPTAQSSAETRMDGLFLKLEEDQGLFGSQARNTDDAQLNNTGPTSPRSMTQEELIPYVMEEKKRKDEERAKQREFDDEMRRNAREELHKKEEEEKMIMEQRRAMFAEERRKLEHQTSLAQEGQSERKKDPVSRTEAGRIIEQELEQQRIREQLTRIEIEKIKEKERLEMEKQKFKHGKLKDEHPSAFQNKDLIQTPIFDEKNDFLDSGDVQSTRISSKRGSVIDLCEDGGVVSDELKKRPVENRPAQVPVYTPSQPQSQPQPQSQLQRQSQPQHQPQPQPQSRTQPNHQPQSLPQPQPQPQSQPQQQPQPVIRKTKDSTKMVVSRKAENRKSFVELDIERQKEREEEAKREAERARQTQAKKQPDNINKGVEIRGDEIKAKEHRPRETQSQTNGLGVKTPPVKKQTELETVVQQTNMAIVESPPVDEIDAKQRAENGGGNSESQSKKVEDEEARRKREEEKEHFRQMQEEERRRREAQKADLDKIRREVDRKEAEEMMRLKLLKEEEKKKQREQEQRKAEERNKESAVRQEVHIQEAASRKTAFAAHKLILEQRVLKALEESKQEDTVTKRRASSFERPTESFSQDEPTHQEEDNADEVFTSAGVKLRKANFEKTGARKDSKEELRKKRYSLNLEQSRRLVTSPEDAALRNKHPGSVGKKYYADDVFAGKGAQAQLEREEELLKRVGYKTQSNEAKLAKAKSLGDLSLKKGQNDDRSPQHVLRKVSFNSGEIDSVDGIPAFSDSRIQKELEEQRMREEVVKKEVTEREKRHRLEEEKKKVAELAAGKKETSLNEIKKNPLPNKIQVKKPSSNRDSLTHSMAAHWETVLQSQEGSEAKDQKERKKSRIEIEKEEERRREEELQKERERVLLEKRQKEEQKKSEKQRKKEEEIERKRQEKEEKEKRQQRTLAMKSLFEKMGKK